MASNYTENFGLCQWEATDQVLRTDFNEDNAKVDAALGTLSETVAEHDSAIARLGNCQIVFGTYTGTGTFGANNPNTLTFDHKPVFVALRRQEQSGNDTAKVVLIHGSTFYYSFETIYDYYGKVIWSDNAVSWYIEQGNYFHQFNASNVIYCYIALLQIGE